MPSCRHILVYEPSTEGHHPKWSGLVASAIHQAGMQVSLAVGDPDKVAPYLLDDIELKCHRVSSGKGLDELSDAAEWLQKTHADEAFWTSLDNFASALLRRAAMGGKPPRSLHGKLSGVYHRPRPLDPTQDGFNIVLKKRGFKNLNQRRWFGRIALLDPNVLQATQDSYPNLKVGLLPDPAEFPELPGRAAARKALGVPENAIALLHFGVFAERKGLGLLLDALEACANRERFFLLRAGKAPADAPELKRMHKLREAGRALSLDEFVNSETEARLYAAADVVTLPYLAHYGSANLLSAAAAAGRPVLASDHHLLGRLVEAHQLGWTFQDGDKFSLVHALSGVLASSQSKPDAYSANLKAYAATCNHDAFSKAVASLW